MSKQWRITVRQVLDEVFADEDSDYDPEITDSSSNVNETMCAKVGCCALDRS